MCASQRVLNFGNFGCTNECRRVVCNMRSKAATPPFSCTHILELELGVHHKLHCESLMVFESCCALTRGQVNLSLPCL